jgi:hypothetical protein
VVQTGPRGELLVAEKLIEHGWSVAPPIGANYPFDLIVNKGDKFHRLQIKSTLQQLSNPKSRPHYQFQLAHGSVNGKRKYTADQVDYFVCCALDTRRFWVIPLSAAVVTTLKIYNGDGSKFHRYEDAWGLLN